VGDQRAAVAESRVVSLVNGDLFDFPDDDAARESGWLNDDEPWPGFDQAAIEAEWNDLHGPVETAAWVDEVIDEILDEYCA
jgi:hypothetical protein